MTIDDDGNRCVCGDQTLMMHRWIDPLSQTSELPIDNGASNPEHDDGLKMVSLMFRVRSRTQKLEFTRWVESTRFGEFRNESAQVFFSSMLVPTTSTSASSNALSMSKKRSALAAFSDLLYDHRDDMKQNTYLKLSRCLKRAHNDDSNVSEEDAE